MQRTRLRFFCATIFAMAGASGLGCGAGDSAGGPGGDGSGTGGSSGGGGSTLSRALRVAGTSPANVHSATAANLARADRAALVTTSGDSPSTLTVWNVSSDGSLQPSSTLDLPGVAEALATGDVDGDGNAEVVVGSTAAGSGQITVLQTTGGASLGIASTTAVAGGDLVQVADLNADGRADVVTASRATGAITVLLGEADGSLQASGTWSLGASPTSLAMIDVNGDGSLDLVAQTNAASPTDAAGSLAVLVGSGAGTFGSTASISSSGVVTVGGVALPIPAGVTLPTLDVAATGSVGGLTLVSGDFNADGHADLALSSASSITVLLGQGQGGFQGSLTGALDANNLASFDFEGNGQVDILAAGSTSAGSSVSVLGAGALGSLQGLAQATVSGTDNGLVAGDFNGDGHVDVAVTTPSSITVLLNSDASASSSTR
jgi:hypothetical protein